MSGEFDKLLPRMQTDESKHALKRSFESGPEELGQAAVRQAAKLKLSLTFGVLVDELLSICFKSKGPTKRYRITQIIMGQKITRHIQLPARFSIDQVKDFCRQADQKANDEMGIGAAGITLNVELIEDDIQQTTSPC